MPSAYATLQSSKSLYDLLRLGTGARRRDLAGRLASANRALASLRISERSERQMLQNARSRLEAATAAASAPMEPVSATLAALSLDVGTHQANLHAIGQQIALVRMAVEHLHRRRNGWPMHHKSDDLAGTNDNIAAGLAAVRALRASRSRRLAASATV